MSTEITKAAPAGLSALAREIQDEHLMCEQAAESAVQHAIRCGELLIEAKSQVKHGEWLPWLKANFPATEQTAQRYMRLSANASRVTDFDSVRNALAELAEPRDPESVARPAVSPEDEHAAAVASTPSASPTDSDDESEEVVTGEVVEPEPPLGPVGPPAPGGGRTDVVAVMARTILRAGEAASTAGQINRTHLSRRTEESAQWARELSPHVAALQSLLDLLEEASG